ncbi:MAG: TonB-dependent receptor [Sulfurospirillaceae bacterium]|nr:TonB-dependent receptor [Sulfurospirillaceae bacterium]MDD2825770.1 TonB-dependent receptor [Sulfurospirillaceae bacterium]
MKNPKGFRGKYFSLAAILALNATQLVAQETQSFADTQANSTPKEYAQSEEETPPLNEIPVVVVSKKIKVSEVSAPFASEVYTQKEIQKSHSKDIYEFLNTQTSVSTISSYGNPLTQAIDMRGYGLGTGYENTVVTVNGRRLNTIDMTPQLLSAIPIDSIEKIEIIKGSGSVEYGDGANAGAINIITKDYEGATVKSHIGDNGLWFGSLGVGVKEEKFSISGYIDDYSLEGFKNLDNSGTKDASWNRNKAIKATFTPIEDLTMNIGKTFSKMSVYYANDLTLAHYNQSPYTIPTSGYNEYYFSSNVFNYGIKYKINSKFSVDAQIFDEDKVSDYITYNSRSNYSYKSYDTKLNYNDTQFKALLGLQAFDGERIAFGNKTSKDNLGIYAKADYLWDAHTLSLGARDEKVTYTYESATRSKDDTSLQAYDIGYNYKINAKTSIFANVNRSFQAPDIDRFFSWGGAFNGFIEPMKVDTYNLGFNYLRYPHTLKATLFYASVDNEIYYNALTGNNTNLKETQKRGVELSEKYNILSNLFTTLNYTYIDTEIIDDGLSGNYNGRAIPGVSPHTLKLSIGYNPIKPLTFIVSDTYKSKTYAIDDFDGMYGKMESYHVTDLSATYAYKNYEFFAKINNLFDEKNAMFASGWSGLGVYPVNYERTFLLGAIAKF